jgi:hypothetical protein
MKRDLMNLIEENNLLTMDGYDDCIIGVVYRACSDQYVVYDTKKIINKLVKEGMSHDEAVEFHQFNQACAWVGDSTPGFVERL